MLLSLSGICIPVSFLAGSALVLSKTSGSSLPPPPLEHRQNRSHTRKRKAMELGLDEEPLSKANSQKDSGSSLQTDYDSEYDDDRVYLRKKARFGETSHAPTFIPASIPTSTSADEVERSLYHDDTTLVDKELVINGDDKSNDGNNNKVEGIRTTTASCDYNDVTDESRLGSSELGSRSVLAMERESKGQSESESETSSATVIVANTIGDDNVDVDNGSLDGCVEDAYDPNNSRHEWELRWFVCAHHAAFTAATGMSLRNEVRRRKTLTRLYKVLKTENTALREEVKRLELEAYGFCELKAQDGESTD